MNWKNIHYHVEVILLCNSCFFPKIKANNRQGRSEWHSFNFYQHRKSKQFLKTLRNN